MSIKNKRASYDYFIEDTIECGIVLTGTEIKSIRKGSASLVDTYARIKNNEVFVINMYISKYDEGNRFNHDERRERKLLLHKSEINKLFNKVKLQGYSLVPIELYIKDNHAKVTLGLCKGKKMHDKREVIKERDISRMNKITY